MSSNVKRGREGYNYGGWFMLKPLQVYFTPVDPASYKQQMKVIENNRIVIYLIILA